MALMYWAIDVPQKLIQTDAIPNLTVFKFFLNFFHTSIYFFLNFKSYKKKSTSISTDPMVTHGLFS